MYEGSIKKNANQEIINVPRFWDNDLCEERSKRIILPNVNHGT